MNNTIYSYGVYKNTKYGYTLVMYRDGEEVDSVGAFGTESIARHEGQRWIIDQLEEGEEFESITVKYYRTSTEDNIEGSTKHLTTL